MYASPAYDVLGRIGPCIAEKRGELSILIWEQLGNGDTHGANDRTNKTLSAPLISANRSALLLAHEDDTVMVDMKPHGLVHILLGFDIDGLRAERALGDYPVVLCGVVRGAFVTRGLPMFVAERLCAMVALEGQEVNSTTCRVATRCPCMQQISA